VNQFGSFRIREGDLLAGKYRVLRVLGMGGMGVVVAARHEELEQLVAIKFVREDALDNDEAVERFLREARSAARLKSEHVARVLDVGRLETGAPYMVMELLEGTDLGNYLVNQGPLPVELAAALIVQVCEAVAEAHAAGIVHRDLKPENLFLTQTVGGSPKMKVLDFGVSKSAALSNGGGKLTRTRTMLGSPLYMAPEQMRAARDVDARLDVWALGVVLFEMVSGRRPFEAETMPELCLKVVNEPPLSLSALCPNAPQGFVAVVERCLQKDRDNRYANAGELASALEPFAPPRAKKLSMRRATLERQADAPPTADRTQMANVSAAPAGAQTPPIPSAWGKEDVRGSPMAPPRRGKRVLAVAVPLVALGALGAAVTLRQGRSHGSPVERSASQAALHESPAALPPAVAFPAAPSGGAVALAPPAPSPELSPIAALPAASVLVAPVPLAEAGVAPISKGLAHLPRIAPSKIAHATDAPPPGQDNDIPALR
jgi:serine/threonine-protein kinase